jgi:2-dehydro-3-deoxygalactonokinase
MSPAPVHFLSCDWGTTAFRLHLVESASGRALATVSSADGIGIVHAAWKAAGGGPERDEFYLRVLRDQVAALARVAGRPLGDLPLVASGMISASIGLRDIPHLAMPFALDGRDLRVEQFTPAPPGMGPLLLISGVRTDDDVMRGEETQVVGAAALGAPATAHFILPGTHSKHVRVAAGRALDVRTYMTGELFDLLARRSILANSVEEPVSPTPPLGGAGVAEGPGLPAGGDTMDVDFTQGVEAGATENLLHAAFGVRVAELSGRRDRRAGWRYLSGLVIGAELHDLARAPAAAPVVLVGSPRLTARYAAALRILGQAEPAGVFTGESTVIAGHRLIAMRVALSGGGRDPSAATARSTPGKAGPEA